MQAKTIEIANYGITHLMKQIHLIINQIKTCNVKVSLLFTSQGEKWTIITCCCV